MPLTPDQKRLIVHELLGTLQMRERVYTTPLPLALQPWYAYTRDGGHSIVIVPPQARTLHPNAAIEDALVPAPVKAVLRVGYTERADGFIECDLPYDATLGLVTEPDDDEY